MASAILAASSTRFDLSMQVQTSFEILNLGCGSKRLTEATNVDKNPRVNPDVIHDLNSYPWPFPNDCFREVLANDVVEHLVDIVTTMEEIHRVCRDRALVRITVPHFSCSNAFADPTHCHLFSWFSFHYFTGEHETSLSSKARFRRRYAKIVFHPSLVNKLVWKFANSYPETYEHRWAWMFPAWFLYFELEVIK